MTASPATPAPPPAAPRAGAWAPLARPVFRALWIASLASNVGTWMHDIGAGWLMKELTDGSSVMVALVQAATTLPFFLLSLPAGALADVLDRRRLILACQGASLVLAAVLAALSLGAGVTPEILLVITLGLGIAAALTNPAWQTVMVDLVPRDELPQAAALNSISINLSRAIGPTIGGFLVAALGPWAAFALNAVSFVGIIVVLTLARRTVAPRAPSSVIAGERFLGAVRAGVRYARHSDAVRAVLARTAIFVLAASALWALLPLIAAQHMGLSASGYGLMLGCLGAGAVTAGALLPRVRQRLGPNRTIAASSVVYAIVLAVMALVPHPAAAYAGMALAGACWLSCVTSFNVGAQSGVPAWVRARALACYLSIFYGAMTLGSALWGYVAQATDIPTSLLIAAGTLLLGLLGALRWNILAPARDDLDASRSWEDPVVASDIHPDDGPVAITVEYRVPAERAADFLRAMEPVSRTRYRDGAISWMLTRDTQDPDKWLELFIAESWAEHLRQHHRVTRADERIQAAARAFHTPRPGEPARPLVRHFIAADPDRAQRTPDSSSPSSLPDAPPPAPPDHQH